MLYSEIIPSHTVATWLLTHIDRGLDAIGLEKERTIEEAIYVVAIVAVAMAIGWAVRRIILAVARKLVKLHSTEIGEELLEQKLFTHCSHVIPPLVLMGLMPFAFDDKDRLLHIMMTLVMVYTRFFHLTLMP